MDPGLSAIPSVRIADEEEVQYKINKAASLIGNEKFYLKVGELLYNKGGMISDGVVAGKRIDEPIEEKSEHHRSVINPCVGELVACMSQVDEFNEIRTIYMTKRVSEGASMQQAGEESKEITEEVIERVSSLKQKMINAQKKVALKAKEISQKKEQIKVSRVTTQKQLQEQIIQCCYTKELNNEVRNALIEQQRAMQEYQNYSKTLHPEVKNYFDKIMNSVGDFCHQFNDYMQRSSEITDMYMYLDDTLTDEFQRHEIKESIINREIREKRNNWLELAETGLRGLEFTALAGAAKVMTNVTREVKLVRAVQSGKDISIKQAAVLEKMILKEAQIIFSSKELQLLKEAHNTGKPLTLRISGRIVQYEPINISGMTLFEEGGFLIGKEAFITVEETKKTLLHELYRLHSSTSSVGISGELASRETGAAWAFAEKFVVAIR
jgi:hypothetical protein